MIVKKYAKSDVKTDLNIALIGPTGYTGHELLRLLLRHPNANIKLLIGNQSKGKNVDDIFSSFSNLNLPKIKALEDVSFKGIDVIFSCMPSGNLSNIIDLLPKNAVIIDLSADFRIKDIKLYEQYYGVHGNKKLLNKFIYGLSEINRKVIKKSKLIACPGCYPTSILLPILPLFKRNIISLKDIIIDSKSGITGAGRNTKLDLMFSENYSSINAYGGGKHRHTPEIEHHIQSITSKKVNIIFTPHLLPINRGILSTIYLRGDISKIVRVLNNAYKEEIFVKVYSLGELPKISDVVGSNFCKIGVMKHKNKDYVILVSVIDNLIKGASGQAIQNMNLIFNLSEELGLDQQPFWP
ncbi:MAG: N-acetyl-gamma-glutamyl-phosphate reductase [Rickettsiales bacterium]|nr:N-acetyl-gamma-glutamyl-phosphate reductase [Rickettsiales bacterium]OUV80299.1 MAG: N-acetyl-gamma-glutamyl-phosphate reductase [Rickettsiales bacterium TMED131]|tara:strand:+ start:752 stop:1810 length:1059 start_codon:yes stop_codon:yes gene_type:complete